MTNLYRTTRLAPSPTGALHLGNARSFLVTWAIARQRDWRIVLRMEDLDTPRTKPWASQQAIDDLRWLGIDWDDEPPPQSADLSPYVHAMDQLAARKLVYPCSLTRTEVLAAGSAPQDGSHEVYFPTSLRTPEPDRPNTFSPIINDETQSALDTPTGWRFVVHDADVEFTDVIAGAQSFNPSRITGDFIVWTKHRQPAYQLAVVVDDHRQGITDVIRGDDLLESTSRQILLGIALGHVAKPLDSIHYWHLPLVVGSDGRRLAKRHGDTRVSALRDQGIRPERVIGLIAAWTGILPRDEPKSMSASEYLVRFRHDRISRDRVVLTPHDEQWLTGE